MRHDRGREVDELYNASPERDPARADFLDRAELGRGLLCENCWDQNFDGNRALKRRIARSRGERRTQPPTGGCFSARGEGLCVGLPPSPKRARMFSTGSEY